MSHIDIIPAILPKDFAELKEKISLVEAVADTVQIDICDGQFTPQATWPYRKHDMNFEKIARQEEGFPYWDHINFEIDLMVNHPEEVVDEWIIAGASRIILHAESKGNLGHAIELIDNRAEIGLAFNIDSEIEFREGISSIQLMGIDHIGFQGQDFDKKVIEKIREVRERYPDIPVSVDGGVTMETAPALIEAGFDRLVVGSAIFAKDNPLMAYENLIVLTHEYN